MKTKTYSARTLFDGSVIGKQGKYVAIPDKFKGFRIEVLLNDEKMIIEKWLNADGYRKFPDKFGRKDALGNTVQYTLGYFKWIPMIEETGQIGAVSALGKMAGTPKWEALRKKLHS